jgi:hypothetical protein
MRKLTARGAAVDLKELDDTLFVQVAGVVEAAQIGIEERAVEWIPGLAVERCEAGIGSLA